MYAATIPSHFISETSTEIGEYLWNPPHKHRHKKRGKALLRFCANILEKKRQYLRWYQCLNRKAVFNLLQVRT